MVVAIAMAGSYYRDTCSEAYADLQKAHGAECMSRTQVYKWFRHFQITVDIDERCGRPATRRIVKKITNVRATVWEITTRNFFVMVIATIMPYTPSFQAMP